MWHEIEKINLDATGEMSAQCQLPVKSKWFSGHFPGKPILPGIAQLAMVKEIIERGGYPSENDNEKDGIRFSRIKFNRIKFNRIKFKRMIIPGERLNITVSPKKSTGVYTFRVSVDDAVASSGNVTITPDG